MFSWELRALRGAGHAAAPKPCQGPRGAPKRALLQLFSCRRVLLLPAGPVLSPACCASRLLLPDPAWCRLQTILKRPGAYEALRGTEDEDEDADQEGAHLLAPEPSSHQEGTEWGSDAQPRQRNGLSNGLAGTSQLELDSGSQRNQQAGHSTGPSSGLKPPAAAQGPDVPLESLGELPEALPEVSVVAPNPVDAELHMGQMAAASQVGSRALSYKSLVDLPGNRWLVAYPRPLTVAAGIQQGHRQSQLCACTVAVLAAEGVNSSFTCRRPKCRCASWVHASLVPAPVTT